MIHRLALLTLTALSPLVLLMFLVPLPFGEGLFAIAASIFPVALMALGASRGGRVGPVAWPLTALLVLLLLVMAGLFALRGQVDGGTWWGGLPAAAAVQLYGLFVLPLFISSIGYARTFRSFSLRERDLDELRRRFSKADPEASSEDGR